MTKIITALTFAIALGLSMTTASFAGGYMEAGSIMSENPSNPVYDTGK